MIPFESSKESSQKIGFLYFFKKSTRKDTKITTINTKKDSIMKDSMFNFYWVWLIGFVSGIGLILTGWVISTLKKKSKPLIIGPEKNQLTPEEMMQALSHLPDRIDPKQLQKWAIERSITNVKETIKELEFLDHKQGLNFGGYLTYLKTDTLPFLEKVKKIFEEIKGPINQTQINLILMEHDYWVDKKTNNPIMERNQLNIKTSHHSGLTKKDQDYMDKRED